MARVVELKGESAAAARLLRVVLGSLDPERAKPRLHARLAALEQRHGLRVVTPGKEPGRTALRTALCEGWRVRTAR